MTSSIDARTRAKVLDSPESESDTISRSSLILGVRVFTALAVAVGIALTVADLASHGGVHLIIPATTSFLMAALGGHLLVGDALNGERRNAYQRGHLDGFMNCLHGRPPEVEDPLYRR